MFDYVTFTHLCSLMIVVEDPDNNSYAEAISDSPEEAERGWPPLCALG